MPNDKGLTTITIRGDASEVFEKLRQIKGLEIWPPVPQYTSSECEQRCRDMWEAGLISANQAAGAMWVDHLANKDTIESA